MLRFFFWLFLLINAGLLAYHFGDLGSVIGDVHDPQRVQRQQNTEAIRQISAEELLVEAQQAAKKKAQITACLEVGNFQTTDADAVEEILQPLNLAERQLRINVTDSPAYIVYIPSMGSKEGAEKKSGELHRLGIKDFFIIQEPSNLNWGVSLGVFKTEEAAKQQLESLIQKGVKTARIGPRTLGQKKFAYQLHVLDGDEKAQFDLIQAQLPPHEIRDCQARPKSE